MKSSKFRPLRSLFSSMPMLTRPTRRHARTAATALALSITLGSTNASALTLPEFRPFGIGAGDTALAACDDCSVLLNYQNPFPQPPAYSWNFFGHTYNQLYVNNNGVVSFGGPVNSFTGNAFPLALKPMIAPYWTDVDTRGSVPGGNKVWYRTTSNSSDLAALTDTVRNHFYGASNFTGTEAFIATWDHVGSYPTNTNLLNTFQMAMISDGNQNYALFNYLDGGMNWKSVISSPAYPSMGFDAGDGLNFYNMPGSRMNDANTTAMTQSNIGVAGQWLFRIDPPQITPPPSKPIITAVPEPETYATLLAGLGILVFSIRRRKWHSA